MPSNEKNISQNNAKEIIPIPEYLQKQLEESWQTTNFSLYFSRMTQWKLEDSEIKKPQEAINKFFKASQGRLDSKPFQSVLNRIHEHQQNLLKYLEDTNRWPVFEFTATLKHPLVSGLGSGHPTETGLVLDRNSGSPYIPASSIKGIMKTAYAMLIAEQKPELLKSQGTSEEYFCIDDEPNMKRYFGDTKATEKEESSSRGLIVFLDAFPVYSKELLKINIMNPHFPTYYQEKNPFPLENDSPIPIQYLSIAEGTTYVFRCFASPLVKDDQALPEEWTEKDTETVLKIFETGLTGIGIGAKKSLGYGIFYKVNEKHEQKRSRLREELRKQEEEQRKLAEEAQQKKICQEQEEMEKKKKIMEQAKENEDKINDYKKKCSHAIEISDMNKRNEIFKDLGKKFHEEKDKKLRLEMVESFVEAVNKIGSPTKAYKDYYNEAKKFVDKQKKK